MYGNRNREKLIGGKYRLTDSLGEGGFGAVYRVRDEHINKEYAMKILPYDHGEILSNEINMLRALEHPGLPSLHDVFTEGNKIFIVMELVEGETLEQYVKARGKLSIKETLYISECLCETVGYLHSRSVPVVHGDLKPQNIIVREGRVSLVDLGGAMKMYGNSQICMGTPGYAPPELAQGKITTESDVYSMGKVMLYMLMGRRINESGHKSVQKLLRMYGVPGKVRKVIHKCLEIQPEHRYAGGKQLKESLTKIKMRKNHFSGMAAGRIATIFRISGILMMLYMFLLYKYGESAGVSYHLEGLYIQKLYLKSLLILLAGFQWDALSVSSYRTAVLECECSMIVTEYEGGNEQKLFI